MRLHAASAATLAAEPYLLGGRPTKRREAEIRPLEILLAFADLMALCLLAIPRLRGLRLVSHTLLIPVLATAAQILFEGPRWQMYPAYVLAGLCSITWVMQRFESASSIIRRMATNRLSVGTLLGLGALGLAASVALGMVLPVFHFPRPSGPYQIGTVTYHWVDRSRHEIFSSDPNASRELMAQVWYPAVRTPSSARAPYVTDAQTLSASVARQLHLPWFIFDYWRYVATDAIPSAPMATQESSYPVLIFLSGVNGYRQSNTFQVEELVSHGYIVVGLDQPYAAAAVMFPDGRLITGSRDQMQPFINQSLGPPAAPETSVVNGQALPKGVIPYLAQDVSFTLDQLGSLNASDPNGVLTGRLDLQHVGTFGVSLGAMVASEACHIDSRLKGCLMMDAAMVPDVVHVGLSQPSLWITRDAATMRLEKWTESDIDQALNTMRTTFAKSGPRDGYYVQVPGMFHVNFTDAPIFSPLAHQIGFTGPIDGQRGHDIINAYSLAFFDQFLEDRHSALLDGPSKQYPEVTLSLS
jgi:hypothetical protein